MRNARMHERLVHKWKHHPHFHTVAISRGPLRPGQKIRDKMGDIIGLLQLAINASERQFGGFAETTALYARNQGACHMDMGNAGAAVEPSREAGVSVLLIAF